MTVICRGNLECRESFGSTGDIATIWQIPSLGVGGNYAMSSLNLLDDDVGYTEIRPVTILSAIRKWKKQSEFKTLRAIVPVENVVVESLNSPGTSNSLSIYHAFASASKA